MSKKEPEKKNTLVTVMAIIGAIAAVAAIAAAVYVFMKKRKQDEDFFEDEFEDDYDEEDFFCDDAETPEETAEEDGVTADDIEEE